MSNLFRSGIHSGAGTLFGEIEIPVRTVKLFGRTGCGEGFQIQRCPSGKGGGHFRFSGGRVDGGKRDIRFSGVQRTGGGMDFRCSGAQADGEGGGISLSLPLSLAVAEYPHEATFSPSRTSTAPS